MIDNQIETMTMVMCALTAAFIFFLLGNRLDIKNVKIFGPLSIVIVVILCIAAFVRYNNLITEDYENSIPDISPNNIVMEAGSTIDIKDLVTVNNSEHQSGMKYNINWARWADSKDCTGINYQNEAYYKNENKEYTHKPGLFWIDENVRSGQIIEVKLTVTGDHFAYNKTVSTTIYVTVK